MRFGRSMRRRFILEPGTAFLNHGSFGATPRAVLAAADRWRSRMEANPDRFMRQVLPSALRAAAARLARFVHAREQDLAFVENATAGMNAVLRSLEFRRGDEILATTLTYNAVRQAIRECAGGQARSSSRPLSFSRFTMRLPFWRRWNANSASAPGWWCSTTSPRRPG